MALEQTRIKLKQVFAKYDSLLKSVKHDIQPNWGVRGNGGNAYVNIERNDIDDIYSSISNLSASISSSTGPIVFDIEGHYISEKKALQDLKDLIAVIKDDIVLLEGIQAKYEDKECAHYPVNTSLLYLREVFELLNVIINSDEVKEFESPGLIANLKNRTNELEFNEYWRKRRRNYILHLLAFLPFLAFIGWLIESKEDKKYLGLANHVIVIFVGIITIFFNLLFNNHNSFKESWKLILPGSRKRLIEKEKKEFLKQQK